MSAAERLLERLDGVRPMGPDRWMARCPAHPDRSPSLSITDRDGQFLFHCHAGCGGGAVLTAAGLSWPDIYGDAGQVHRAADQAAHHRKARIDPLALERRILEIAEYDLRAGRQLSVEDQARVQLALERIEAAA